MVLPSGLRVHHASRFHLVLHYRCSFVRVHFHFMCWFKVILELFVFLALLLSLRTDGSVIIALNRPPWRNPRGGATAPLTGLFGGTREGGACTLAEGYTPARAGDLWSSLRTSMDGCSWADAADSFQMACRDGLA